MSNNPLNTILYIDDDEQLRTIAEISLATVGDYTVKLCASGTEAITLLKEFKFNPDIILLDAIMPNMDGLATLTEIRKLDSHKDTKVILVTGLSNTDFIEPFKLLGVDDIITKPFNPMQLATQVQSIWNQYDD